MLLSVGRIISNITSVCVCVCVRVRARVFYTFCAFPLQGECKPTVYAREFFKA